MERSVGEGGRKGCRSEIVGGKKEKGKEVGVKTEEVKEVGVKEEEERKECWGRG